MSHGLFVLLLLSEAGQEADDIVSGGKLFLVTHNLNWSKCISLHLSSPEGTFSQDTCSVLQHVTKLLLQTWGYEGNRSPSTSNQPSNPKTQQQSNARINTSNSEHASNSSAAFPAEDNDEDEDAFLKEALEIRSV